VFFRPGKADKHPLQADKQGVKRRNRGVSVNKGSRFCDKSAGVVTLIFIGMEFVEELKV
jgi:hypothetical protein